MARFTDQMVGRFFPQRSYSVNLNNAGRVFLHGVESGSRQMEKKRMNKKLKTFLLALSLLVTAGSTTAAGPVGWPIGEPAEEENADNEEIGVTEGKEGLFTITPIFAGGLPVGISVHFTRK